MLEQGLSSVVSGKGHSVLTNPTQGPAWAAEPSPIQLLQLGSAFPWAAWWWLPASPQGRAFSPPGSAPTVTQPMTCSGKQCPPRVAFLWCSCALCALTLLPAPVPRGSWSWGLRQDRDSTRKYSAASCVRTCFAMPLYSSTARHTVHRDWTEALLNLTCSSFKSIFIFFSCFLNIGEMIFSVNSPIKVWFSPHSCLICYSGQSAPAPLWPWPDTPGGFGGCFVSLTRCWAAAEVAVVPSHVSRSLCTLSPGVTATIVFLKERQYCWSLSILGGGVGGRAGGRQEAG